MTTGYRDTYDVVDTSTITDKKLKNHALAQAEKENGHSRLKSLPSYYVIDPTNLCNLSCALCPTKYRDSDMPKGFIDIGLYKSLVDKIQDYAIELHLYNWGEALLHKEIVELVKYAADKKIFTFISSNFSLPLTKDHIRDLFDAGLGLLHVDVDGITDEVYSAYRIGGSLSRVLQNLDMALQIKAESGRMYPIIETAMIVNKYNEKEQEAYRNLMRSMGVDNVVLSRLQLNPNLSMDDWMPSEQSFRHQNYIEPDRDYSSCDLLYHNMTINWDGRVSACCHTYDINSDFGTIDESTSLHDIWNNEYFISARASFKDKCAVPSTICHQCQGNLGKCDLKHFRDTFAITL